MSARGLFVTGTDTGVGKTLVACALARAFAARGERVAVMKPVASGAARTPAGLRNEDAQALLAASNVRLAYEEVNPYCFEPAISPHIAAEEAGIAVDIDMIVHNYRSIAARADRVIVEGAGGWLAPVNARETMAGIARALEAPVVLAVGLKLGCLNHAQLTQRAIAGAGARFAGWIASALDPGMARASENLASLERLLGGPALAIVPFLQPGDAVPGLAAAAARLAENP
jgi:dethiobiotin synthetase